jgi:hypothetical protein
MVNNCPILIYYTCKLVLQKDISPFNFKSLGMCSNLE